MVDRLVYPFCFALWVVGLCFALMPLDAYEAVCFLLSFLCLAGGFGLAVYRILGARRVLALTRSGWGLMGFGSAFWGMAFLSVLFSEAPFDSFLYFCFFSALPVSFLLYGLLREWDGLKRALFWVVGVFFTVLPIAYFAHYVVLDVRSWGNGIVAWPLANPNSMAAVFSIGFFAASGVVLYGDKRLSRVAAIVIAGISLAAIELAGSKAGMVSLLLSLGVFMGVEWARFKAAWRGCVGILLAFVFAGILVDLIAQGQFFGFLPLEHMRVMSGNHITLAVRYDLWHSALAIAQENWITGTGIGTFFLYYPEYRVGDFASAGLMAHSDPLQFLAEMGVAAVLAFYGFIGLALWRAWRVLCVMKPDDARRGFVLVPFFALGAMIVHTHVSFHLYVLVILMLSGVLLAIWFYVGEAILRESGKEPRKVVLPQWCRGQNVVLTLLVLLSVGFVTVQSSEVFLADAKRDSARADFEGFVEGVNAAGRVMGGKNPRALVLAAAFPLEVLEDRVGRISREEAQKLFDTGIGQLAVAERFNPRLASIYYLRARYGDVGAEYGLDIRGVDVMEELERALRVNPRHVEARAKLARLSVEAVPR